MIASFAFMKLWAKWTSSAMVCGSWSYCLWINKSELTPRQGFPVEASDERPQALIFSLLYSQQAGWGAFVPLSSDKVVDKQLTQLFERINSVWRYLAKPHLCWPLKGGWEGPAHYLIWNFLKVHCGLEGALWSHGLRVPSYESKEGILNLEGRRWLLMEAMKGESIRYIKLFTWFILRIFSFISSMTLFIGSISLSKCGTLREAVPLEWFLCSTFSPSLTSWLWACPSTRRSWRCLLWLISWVNSWFWRVNSAIAAAMNCICWMEGGCVVGAHWWARLGWLEAFSLSWWLGLVAIDLVWTIQPFV